MAGRFGLVVLLVVVVGGLTAPAESWAAEPTAVPYGWSPMSQYGALAAPACGAPNGYAGYQACCPKSPHCCDNAWACYCEWKAKWHSLWSRVGEPPCGYCGICGAKGCQHMAYSSYTPADMMVPDSGVPTPTPVPAPVEQLGPMPQPIPIPQPTPAAEPEAPSPLPTPPLPGPGLSEPIEPTEPPPPQAPESPSSSSARIETDATPASGGPFWRRLLPWGQP